ncbi:MAG: RsmE family RNA methyltransferase [bacterium]
MKTISETSFYAPPEQIQNDTLHLSGQEAKHGHRVLRCTVGDLITVVDGCGGEYVVSVESTSRERIDGKILRRRKGRKEPSSQVTLAQALCRGPKFDTVVEKATELGVRAVFPTITERSLPPPDNEHLQTRMSRWRKIAIGAMKQSGRALLPRIEPALSFDSVLCMLDDFDLSLIAWEGEKESGLARALKGAHRTEKVLILVGPEGGFSQGEVRRAITAGALPFSLGPRRLRTETAGLVSLSLLLYELGDLGNP